jgi:hypothetical protein
MNFSGHECSLLHKALRYYQINKTITDSKEYWECDFILRKLQPHVEINGIEPMFRTDT